MLKLYRAQHDAQLRWIRNHPVQYVALNAILIAGFVGYIKYQEHREARKFDNPETTPAQ